MKCGGLPFGDLFFLGRASLQEESQRRRIRQPD